MGVFFLLVAVALVALIGYAAYADHKARRDGEVIVPIKHGLGRRTTFVRMGKAELEEQKLAAAYEEQQRQRSERARLADEVQTVKPFGGIFGGASRRLRGR